MVAGRYATNFQAEAMALNTAASEILTNRDKTHKKDIFFSDALSALDALQNHKKKKLNNLTSIMSQLNDRAEVTLQWIPAHCVSSKDEKTSIKSLTARKWHLTHPDSNLTDGYH